MGKPSLLITQIHHDAIEQLTEFQNVSRPPLLLPISAESHLPHWLPPLSLQFKSNYDRTIFDDTNCAGLGVVIRNSKGLVMQGIKPNSQPVRNKKYRENTRQRKQLHAQDNIYVVQQFSYVHGVARISLLSGKNTEYNLWLQYLSLTQKHSSNTLKP